MEPSGHTDWHHGVGHVCAIAAGVHPQLARPAAHKREPLISGLSALQAVPAGLLSATSALRTLASGSTANIYAYNITMYPSSAASTPGSTVTLPSLSVIASTSIRSSGTTAPVSGASSGAAPTIFIQGAVEASHAPRV